MYLTGLPSLLLNKAKVRESEKKDKDCIVPVHHCSVQIRMQHEILILIETHLGMHCEYFFVTLNCSSCSETM
jgi:hypothetical protein